jgi:CheY-like chemotaxis protein
VKFTYTQQSFTQINVPTRILIVGITLARVTPRRPHVSRKGDIVTRILVVEDDPTTVLMLRLALELAGYQVFVAGHGREALDLLSQVQPAVVLSDVMMPIMGGLELARAIHENPAFSATKVVLVSAVKPPAADGVCQAFIQKPFDVDDVLAVVARLTTGSEVAEPLLKV